MKKTSILIVDDSALIRQLLTEIISHDPELEVVGTASDPYIAWEKIKRLDPDVLTLDVEMPRMDGLTFLQKLMRVHPMPVLMVSSLTERGCETTLKALEAGAIDFITKPKVDITRGTVELGDLLLEKIKAVAQARPRPRVSTSAPPASASASAPVRPAAPRPPLPAGALARSTDRVIAIGASTGGTEALREFLAALPPDTPGIVVVQHMPEHFTRSFAQRLDAECRMRVREASDGERIIAGHVLIAPGNRHLSVERSGGQYIARVHDGEPVNRHRPSVDVLFHSCARSVGANAVGVILTGMGNDGARGLLAMHDAGAATIAQDEATCVVFGMPREAIALGAADQVLRLERIPGAVLRQLAAR